MDPRRSEIQGSMKGCGDLTAFACLAVLLSGAVYAAGLIALTNLIGGV